VSHNVILMPYRVALFYSLVRNNVVSMCYSNIT